MILSRADIEWIAADILKRFDQADKSQFPETDIDRLAEQYLKLSVYYRKLSPDGNLLGLTAYDDIEFVLRLENEEEILQLNADTVLLEKRFLQRHIPRREKQKNALQRRFTLAHECAHQILFRMESAETRESLKQQYSQRKVYDCYDLKMKEDWNEWQANTLGAALLMPADVIERYFERYQGGTPLFCYGGRYPRREQLAISHLTGFFGVSKTALHIRLKALGYILELPAKHYYDPSVIIADEFD